MSTETVTSNQAKKLDLFMEIPITQISKTKGISLIIQVEKALIILIM